MGMTVAPPLRNWTDFWSDSKVCGCPLDNPGIWKGSRVNDFPSDLDFCGFEAKPFAFGVERWTDFRSDHESCRDIKRIKTALNIEIVNGFSVG